MEGYTLVQLKPDAILAPFDCGDDDLNGFLANDAATYQKERFAVTHLLIFEAAEKTQIAGYFCLLTDKLVFDPSDKEQRIVWKTFNKQNKIHFNKHRKNYPSVKIGRLAIANVFAGQGLGRYLMGRIIYMINNIDNIGCRFITVDAYRSAFDFYLKNDFRFLSDDDEDDETRVMYFDIKRFAP
ncbi:MAG: GNAT family N-acetyltransferase [Tannerella sp.]|jgi:predicted GNAT family N-acyltransferase|nr:GNAT family N-acetyltransferase [Tannerella sp.]